MTSHVVIRSLAEFMPYADEWDAIHVKNKNSEVYQHSSFLIAWMKAAPIANEPFIICCFHNQQLISGLPLMLKQELIAGIRVEVVVPMGTPLIDYIEPIYLNEEALAYLADTLNSQARKVDAVLLENVRMSSPLYPHLIRLGYRQQHFVNCYSRKVTWSNNADLSEIVIGRTNLRMLRGKYNRIARIGELSLSHEYAWTEIDSVLDSFFTFHIERWKHTDTPSMFTRPEYRAFYREMLCCMKENGTVLLSQLKVGDVLIGVHFGLKFRSKLIWYTPAMNVEYSKFSVGNILATEIARNLPNMNLTLFDFSRGGEQYKMQFCDIEEENLTLSTEFTVKALIIMWIRRNARLLLKSNTRLRSLLITLFKKDASLC